MKNWSVDEKFLKRFPQKYELWKLEQMLSYGLDDGERVNKKNLLKNWSFLSSRIDPNRVEFLRFILWQ